MPYPPDYEYPYHNRLTNRGLDITPDEIREGLQAIEAHGMLDADAETSMLVFLARLIPSWADKTHPVRFQGWESVGAELNRIDGTMSELNDELTRRFGNDAIRVALVIRHRYTPELTA